MRFAADRHPDILDERQTYRNHPHVHAPQYFLLQEKIHNPVSMHP